MIQSTDKYRCCGCGACAQICPKKCITMTENEEGFLYPHVIHKSCSNCGLCTNVCPVTNKIESSVSPKVVIAKNANEEQRLNSSSGGIFILLAEYVVKTGGVVFGARFNDKWEVVHSFTEKEEELDLFMRSKYVQSRIGESYKEVESFLKQGRTVLFTGTSCQILALNLFLKKEYDNLLTVDVICHGVPSPLVWRTYLEELKRNYVKSHKIDDVNISYINFRGKQNHGYTWKNYGFVVLGETDKKQVSISSKKHKSDSYMKAFLSNLTLRPSCYNCPSKGGKSMSDMTIADYWKCKSAADDLKGVSLVLLNTTKGCHFFSSLGIQSQIIDFDQEYQREGVYYNSVSMPIQRALFWQSFFSCQSVIKAESVANYLPLFPRLKKQIKTSFKDIYRSLRRLLNK